MKGENTIEALHIILVYVIADAKQLTFKKDDIDTYNIEKVCKISKIGIPLG